MFVSKGFSNWKDFLEKMQDHVGVNKMHASAEQAYLGFKDTQDRVNVLEQRYACIFRYTFSAFVTTRDIRDCSLTYLVLICFARRYNAAVEQVKGYREYVKMLADTLLMLAKQGLAMRGHREGVESKSRGNFFWRCCPFWHVVTPIRSRPYRLLLAMPRSSHHSCRILCCSAVQA